MNRFSLKPSLQHCCASIVLFFVCCFMFLQQTVAQDFQFIPDVKTKRFYARQNLSYQFSTSHSDLNVEVDQWNDMNSNSSWDDNYEFPIINDIIKVGIDHDGAIVANTPYRYEIVLSISGYPYPNVNPDVIQHSFIIENNNDSLVAYTDLSVFKPQNRYYRMEIQIVSITRYDPNNPTVVLASTEPYSSSNIIKNFYIESSIRAQRYDKLPNQKLVVNALPDNTTNELRVGWAYSTSTSINCNLLPAQAGSVSPVKYELEWTYVDDYKFNYNNWTTGYKNTSGSFSVPYDFRNNATRIQTYNNFFRIPIIYEHGTIVYRVRAIRPDPVNLSKLIYSPWTLLSNTGTLNNSLFPINQVGAASLNCVSQCMYLIGTPFEGDKFDWQYSINFAEEGKYKHVLNYFDGAGHNRQTQTKINSDNQYIIAADHIYDYEGRPSIQTLPIPVQSQNLDYKNNLSYRDGSSPLSPYTAADFDKECNNATIPAFAGVSLAGTYYSSANPDQGGLQKFVPDAEGYPFIQTIYSPDNTNKVLIQGGAGRNFQVDKGHVTSNTYVRADQTELNKLFGTQAGRAEYYPKVITKDPNGQLSYSIFNQSGKVVATALVGGAPDNNSTPIVALDGLPAPLTVTPTPDILANLTQSTGDGMRSANYAFSPEASGNSNTLTYQASIPPYPTGCTGTDNYINVKGQYKVKIVNECGTPVQGSESTQDVGQTGFATGTVASPPSPQTTPGSGIVSNSFTLDPVKYTLIKELYFSDAEIKKQADLFTDNNSGINNCYDYEDNFIRKSVDKSIVPCKKSEEPTSHCDLLKRKMMDELYPGAKYGKYEKTEDGKFLSGLPNSIFTLVNDVGESFDPNIAYPGGGTSVPPTSPCSYTKQCSYENGGGPVNGNGNQLYNTTEVIPCASDYTPIPAPGVVYTSGNLFCQNSAVTCTDYKYRYQWCLTLPNITFCTPPDASGMSACTTQPGGHFSPDVFIANFNDATAEALLPFHPEYCKLLFCDDSYPEFLSKIKTYQEAQILGVTTLTAIINQDPLFNSTNPNGPFVFAELNRLEKPSSVSQTDWDANPAIIPFARPLDIQALDQAYCGCENMEAVAYCRNQTYYNQIKNFTGTLNSTQLSDVQLADAFIRNLISMYIANRTIRVQKKMEATNNCGSICEQDFRIPQVIAPPAMADVFGSGSAVNQLTGMPSDFVSQFNNALNGSTITVPSSFTATENASKYSDCEAEVKSFAEALKYYLQGNGNGLGASNFESVLRNATGCVNPNSTGPFSKLTPQSVQGILGSGLSEYWNPYLAAYNTFDLTQSKPPIDLVSKKPAFYAGLKAFLNRPEVENALSDANSGTPNNFTIDPANNKFESELAVTLGGSSITAKAYTKTVSDQYILSKYNGLNDRNYIALVLTNGSNFDTLYLSKRVGTVSGYDVGITNVATTSFEFSDVQSVLYDPAYIGNIGGTLRDNLAFAKLNGIANGNPATDNYVIWGYKTSMLNPKDLESPDGCLNCVDIKNTLNDYFTDATTLGLPVFASHPTFKRCLTNYLNYKLGKKHTYGEYEKLMKGCSVSNYFAFGKTPGQIFLNNLSPAAVNTLVTGINALSNDDVPVSVDYFSYAASNNSSNGDISLWIDLNSVPYTVQVAAMKYVSNTYGTTTNGFNSDLFLDVLIPDGSPTPDWSFLSSVNISLATTVYMKNTGGSYTIPYKKYTFTGASAAADEATVANVIDAVKRSFLEGAVNNSITGAVFLESREVMRSEDYYKTTTVSGNIIYPKQNYLNYAYGLSTQGLNGWDISANLAPSVLKGSNGIVPVMGMDFVSYNNPWCSGAKAGLSYTQAPNISTDPGWKRLTGILKSVYGQLTGNKLFPSANNTTVSSANLSSDLNTGGPTPSSKNLQIIKMSNGRAWYRFFDDNNKLYNVYLIPAERMFSGGWQVGNASATPPVPPSPPAENGQSGYIINSTNVNDLSSWLEVVPDGNMYCFKVKMKRAFTNGTHEVVCYGYTDFPLKKGNVLMDVVLDDGPSQCIDTMPCERAITLAAIGQGKAMYAQYIDSIKQAHFLAMREWFPSHTTDKLFMTAIKQQYQYTLYNYDLAGNLTSTVPPMGVDESWINTGSNASNVDNWRNSGNIGSGTVPSHTKKSEYWYNSFNQLIKQKTPDAGETKFYYDKSGKLAFSQNAKQLADGKFAYTLYDDQDRIKETGVVYLAAPDVATNAQTRTSAEIANIISGKLRDDVVATFYDEPVLLLNTYTNENLNLQENLRKRVSSILYMPKLAANDAAASHFSYGTHFSYDALGNVKTLVQDNPYMDYLGQRFKRIDYDYDLLSGKVNLVSYNRGRADEFYQKYKYDADNRIIKVESSNDGLDWDRDACYTYYKHGPLAQMSIGDLNVQSVQYAYTIQGWLKAINGDVLDSTVDMGYDGVLQPGETYPLFPSDVIAHALDYHPGDYIPIGSQQVQSAGNANTIANNANTSLPYLLTKGLYNGNIARQTTAISHLSNMQRNYSYDQLNRITGAGYYNVDNITKAVTDMAAAFANAYSYDKDGNIATLTRKDGNSTVIDNLAYNYQQTNLNPGNVAKDNNMLQYVTDQNGTGDGLPGSQLPGNYKYDQIGNLIKDVQGHIENIKWNAYGKVTDIQIDGDNKKIHYDYDALGNRVRKDVLTLSGQNYTRNSDIYVRDASGNILAVYKGKSTIDQTYTIQWINAHLNDYHGGFLTEEGYGIAPFLADEFGNNGQFTNTLFDLAQVQDLSWCEEQVNAFGLSDYLQMSDQLYRQVVRENTESYFNDLVQYDEEHESNIIKGCFSYTDLITRDFSPILLDLMKIDPKIPASEDRLNATFFSMSQNAPDFTEELFSNLGVSFSSDNQLNADNLVKEVDANGDKNIMPFFNNSADMFFTELKNFATAVVSDAKIVTDGWLIENPASKEAFQDALINTSERVRASGFFASWKNDNDPDWLVNNTSMNDRLNIVFQSDKVSFLNKYATQLGMESINAAIVSISQMTLSNYTDLLWHGVHRGTLNPGYTPPDVITPDPTNLLADRLDLAEHHLYGSSRLGIKTYPEAKYRVSYASASPTLSENTLGEHLPWYSGGYATWIAKDKTDPFTGNTANFIYAAMENSRTLGMKQYEMTDHLGNVLATVLDKKTGFGDLTLGSGDHVYKGFYANLSSVTDYYPFGMPMVGRTKEADLFANNSKFGYNGQLRTDEVYGNGNLNTALFGELDTRLARRWNIDPKPNFSISNYAVFANSPINVTDVLLDTVLIGVHPVKDKMIYDAASRQDDEKNTIHIFAHGAPTIIQMHNESTGKTTNITTPEQFDQYMTDLGIPEWEKAKKGGNITVILHSCRTGANTVNVNDVENGTVNENTTIDNSFARKLSIAFPNISVIAPTERDYFNKDGEVGPYKTTNTDINGEKIHKSPWMRRLFGENKYLRTEWHGSWKTYRDGEVIQTHDATWKPTRKGSGK